MMSPEFDFPEDDTPSLSPPAAASAAAAAAAAFSSVEQEQEEEEPKEPEHILVRAPTLKKSYKVRTPVHVGTLERVFSLSSPYLISPKTKVTLVPDAEGVFHISSKDPIEYVVMGKKPKDPQSPSSSAAASFSAARDHGAVEKAGQKAATQQLEKSKPTHHHLSKDAPTSSYLKTQRHHHGGTAQADKAAWDDLEEDLADEPAEDFRREKEASQRPPPEVYDSGDEDTTWKSSSSSPNAKKQPSKLPPPEDLYNDDDDNDDDDDDSPPSLLSTPTPQARVATQQQRPATSPPKPSSLETTPRGKGVKESPVVSHPNKAAARPPPAQFEDDDLEDDFEVLDVSPENTPSVRVTWQEQLRHLQEAYQTMELEHHKQYLTENAQYLAGNAQYYLAETAGVMKSVYTFVRNPLTNNYTALEQTQMRAIHSIYRATIAEEIPFELRIDAEFLRPVTKVSVEDLNKNSWVRTLGDGHLAHVAEDLVTNICAYQQERYNRKYWRGYLDDPTNLFLDEMKRWLVSFLSKTPLDHNAYKKVQGRISYLTDLLAADIFQPGAGSQTTMKMVLVNCKKTFEELVLPTIQQEMLNSSARDHLDLLVKYTKMTLHHCVIYLFYVLRSNPEVPNNCTLDNIRNPPSKDLMVALNTGSGVCLRALVASEPFSMIFQPKSSQPSESTDISFPTVGNVALKNAFISQQGEAIIPEVIGTVGENAKITMKENSGIHGTFHQKFVIDSFVRFHGLLQELAFALVLILQAKSLAGVGGELLVYGMANRQMNMVIRIYGKLIEALSTCMKTLDEVGKSRYEELVFQNNNQEKVWPRHFSISSSLKNRIEVDIANSMKAAKVVEEHANERQIQDRLKSAKAQTEQFTADASRFCSKVAGLLSLRNSDLANPLPPHFAIMAGSD